MNFEKERNSDSFILGKISWSLLMQQVGFPELKNVCEKYKEDIKLALETEETDTLFQLRQVKGQRIVMSCEFEVLLKELQNQQANAPKLSGHIECTIELSRILSKDLSDYLFNIESKLTPRNDPMCELTKNDDNSVIGRKDVNGKFRKDNMINASFMEWRDEIHKLFDNMKKIKMSHNDLGNIDLEIWDKILQRNINGME